MLEAPLSNIPTVIGNYSFFYDDEVPEPIACRSSLELQPDSGSLLGGWYFNGQPLGDNNANCLASASFGQIRSPESGEVLLQPCSQPFQLNLQSEGIYTCRILDHDFQERVFQVGIYFRRGG